MRGKPTLGSLFSGIGGLDLGLERSGCEVKWMVEIDDYCTAVLNKHWPKVPKFRDVRKLTGSELEPVDLVCGGFPCQPISLAGRRRGTADERWLWPDMARLVGILRPRFVFVENVPGLASLGLADIAGDLATLLYDAEGQVIPAAAAGAPHLRYREFLVAYPCGVRGPNQGQTTQYEERAGVITDSYRIGWGLQPQPISQCTNAAHARNNGEAWTAADPNSEGRPHIFRGTTATRLDGLRTVSAGHWDEWPEIPWAVGKRINPEWAEWYMGFPSGWTDVDGAKPRQRLAALGNAVVPQVAEWVGRMILTAMEEGRI